MKHDVGTETRRAALTAEANENSRAEMSFSQEVLREVAEQVRGAFPRPSDACELVLIDVDPRHVHAFWNIPPATLSGVRAALDLPEDTLALVLRLTELTPRGSLGDSFDIEVLGLQGQFYLDIWGEARRYQGSIGLRRRDGGLAPLAQSNILDLPPLGPSTDKTWREIALPPPSVPAPVRPFPLSALLPTAIGDRNEEPPPPTAPVHSPATEAMAGGPPVPALPSSAAADSKRDEAAGPAPQLPSVADDTIAPTALVLPGSETIRPAAALLTTPIDAASAAPAATGHEPASTAGAAIPPPAAVDRTQAPAIDAWRVPKPPQPSEAAAPSSVPAVTGAAATDAAAGEAASRLAAAEALPPGTEAAGMITAAIAEHEREAVAPLAPFPYYEPDASNEPDAPLAPVESHPPFAPPAAEEPSIPLPAAEALAAEPTSPTEPPPSEGPEPVPLPLENVLSLSSFVMAGGASEFEINAELHIFGHARSGLKLQLFGQPVAIRPDGSFSINRPLPHGALVLSVLLAKNGERND